MVKDDSPKINKLLYKSRNITGLIFIISAQSLLARKYLPLFIWSFQCIALLYVCSLLFILWSDLHLCVYLPAAGAEYICSTRVVILLTEITSLNVKCVYGSYTSSVCAHARARRKHKKRIMECRHWREDECAYLWMHSPCECSCVCVCAPGSCWHQRR